jgi:putative transposase
MARSARFVAIKQAHLVAQTALDGLGFFRENADFVKFLALLKISSKVNNVAIHGYVLLPSEIMLIATPAAADSLSKLMQWVGRRYVPYYNRKYGRAGPLWRSRFKSAVIEAASHLLAAYQYVEEAPVRASLGSWPGDYPWSSFHAHAGLQPDALVSDHPSYWSLGNTPFDREAAYRRLMEHALPSSILTLIESGLRSGWAIGSTAFAESLQKLTGRRLTPATRGRPPGRRGLGAPKRSESVPN